MEENDAKIPTKDRIIYAALDLFSENGYDGTGMDQIGAASGLKGPSLYRHYKGKEDILNVLIEKMDVYYSFNFGIADEVHVPESMDEFVAATMARVRFTIGDAQVRKIRKFLAKEQFRNAGIAELTTSHELTGLRAMNRAMFAGMIRNGLFKDYDPDMMALAFVSPITLLIHKSDRHPEEKGDIIREIEEFIDHFISVYGAGKAE